jgi:hypothetical protein
MVRHNGNIYIITVKNTLAPLILPLFKGPAEDLFWDLLEFGHHIWFYVLHSCETGPLETHVQKREQQDTESTLVGWRQELLHNKQCVARCVVVIQKPLSLPATCHAASSAELAQENTVQVVQTHGAPNRRCQRIPRTFWLTLIISYRDPIGGGRPLPIYTGSVLNALHTVVSNVRQVISTGNQY